MGHPLPPKFLLCPNQPLAVGSRSEPAAQHQQLHSGSLSLTAQHNGDTLHSGPRQKGLLCSVPIGVAYEPLIPTWSRPDPCYATHPKPLGMTLPVQPAYAEITAVSMHHLLPQGALAVPCAQCAANLLWPACSRRRHLASNTCSQCCSDCGRLD